MRRRPWNQLLLLSCALLGGAGALAQYSPPATPAPYNPIALAEVTGAPRAAVQAGQNNYQTLSQNPYLGGVACGKTQRNASGAFPRRRRRPRTQAKSRWSSGDGCSLPTRGDSAGKR